MQLFILCPKHNPIRILKIASSLICRKCFFQNSLLKFWSLDAGKRSFQWNGTFTVQSFFLVLLSFIVISSFTDIYKIENSLLCFQVTHNQNVIQYCLKPSAYSNVHSWVLIRNYITFRTLTTAAINYKHYKYWV